MRRRRGFLESVMANPRTVSAAASAVAEHLIREEEKVNLPVARVVVLTEDAVREIVREVVADVLAHPRPVVARVVVDGREIGRHVARGLAEAKRPGRARPGRTKSTGLFK
jgi:hypothetical protein